MKIFITFLKVIAVLLTTVWGVLFGGFTSLYIYLTDFIEIPEISKHWVLIFWCINSVVFYLGSTILTVLNKTKIAAITSIIAFINTMIIHGVFLKLFAASEGKDPSFLYLPSVFITLVVILIAVFTNLPSWLEDKDKRDRAKAPSILSDNKTKRR